MASRGTEIKPGIAVPIVGVLFAVLMAFSGFAQEPPAVPTGTASIDIWNGCVGIQTGTSAESTFNDPLPAGAQVKKIRLGLKNGRFWSSDAGKTTTVVAHLNNVQAGSPMTTGQFASCNYDDDVWNYLEPLWVETPDFPSFYNYGSVNTIRQTVTTGVWASNAGVFVEIDYELGFGLQEVNPTGQTKMLTRSVSEHQFTVRLTAPAGTTAQLGNQPIQFKVTPPGSSQGTALSVDGSFGNATTLSVNTDASGYATVRFQAGEADGIYQIEATNPQTNTGEVARFDVLVIEPSSIEVWRIEETATYMAVNEQVIPLSPATRFRALARGTDPNGITHGLWFREVQWLTAVPKGTKEVASLSLQPDSFDPSTVDALPGSFGSVALVASPPAGKYGTLKSTSVNMKVGGAILDVHGDFDPAAPNDDMDWWVPGAIDAEHHSAPPPAEADWNAPIQKVWLHMPAAKANGAKNPKVKFQLSGTTTYDGVAMNWPPENVTLSTPEDLWFVHNGQRSQNIEVALDPDGFTSVELNVADYAAKSTLTVTVDGAGATTISIPRTNKYSNSIPDIGWGALNDVGSGVTNRIQNNGEGPSLDNDTIPYGKLVERKYQYGSSVIHVSQDKGRWGDGLTFFEEYRGCVVGSQHRRLNPWRKDLAMLYLGNQAHLGKIVDAFPITFAMVRDEEVAFTRTLGTEEVAPRFNFRSSGVPGGAKIDRALFFRTVYPGPKIKRGQFEWRAFATENGYLTNRAYGITFYNEVTSYDIDVDVSPEPGSEAWYHAGHSPDGTLVAEIYPNAFAQTGILPGEDGVLHSAANLLCEGPDPGCDEPVYQDGVMIAILPGFDMVVDTKIEDNDEGMFRTPNCQGLEWTIWDQKADSDAAKATVIIHEIGHGLNLYHGDTVIPIAVPCPSVMNSWLAHPFASSLSDTEKDMIRTHENY